MADLTTLERVKQYLGQDSGFTDDDQLLQSLLSAASEEVRQYCCQDFDLAKYTQTYSGTGNRFLQLDKGPIRSVLSLSINGYPMTPAVGSTGPGYVIAGKSLAQNSSWWWPGIANISVVYVAGYETVPQDVQQSVVYIVALRYKLKEHIGMTSRAKGDSSDTYSEQDLPGYIQEILNKYRDPDLAIALSSLKEPAP